MKAIKLFLSVVIFAIVSVPWCYLTFYVGTIIDDIPSKIILCFIVFCGFSYIVAVGIIDIFIKWFNSKLK